MNKRRAHATHAKAAEPPKVTPNDVMPELFDARNKPPLDTSAQPLTYEVALAVGPNVDGLSHQALLSHAADEDERTLIANTLAPADAAKE